MSKLKKLIQKNGLTVLELAQKLNIERVYIYSWYKKHTPSLNYMLKLCEILKCEPKDLINKKEKK